MTRAIPDEDRRCREIEALISSGRGVCESCREIGISEKTFYRWKKRKQQEITDMLKAIDRFLTPSDSTVAFAELVFRVFTSLIFIIGGLGHFGRHQMMLDRMADSPWRDTVNAIGDPSLLLWLSGAAFVVFGIALALGFMTRLSALVILLTLLPITFFTHIAPGHTGPLFKNIAIMGALILLTAKGGGAYAIDKRSH